MSTKTILAMVTNEAEQAAPETFPFLLPVSINAFKLLPEERRFTAADFELFAAENPDL